MNAKTRLCFGVFMMSIIAVVFFISRQGVISTYAQEAIRFQSPLPTPTPEISSFGRKALIFLSEKYGIPVEHLLIEYELETGYPLTARTFRHFVISNTHDPHWTTYSVSVEIHTDAIEEDITAIERAEAEAYLAKYGKLERALYERLQEVADDTVLPVAIWAAGKPVYTADEILAILASEFPEAAKAIANHTKPTDVENPETAEKIQIRYEELLTENADARLHLLETWLDEQGYRFTKFDGMPSLTTEMPKADIQKLAQLDAVGMLYLIEEKVMPGLDIASASDRAPTVWQRTFTGNGVRVAILDINRVNPPCLNIVATKDASLPIADHATKVANIVGCNADPHRGIAYNASIVDGGFVSSQPNLADSLKWSTASPQSARVVNASVGTELDGDIHWLDKVFDYWTRNRNLSVAILSHNDASYVRTPGKAWNVITVGGSNDQNTANWSDDGFANFSNYIDPTGGESGTDREKPEVVAPAVGITSANGNAAGNDGTSLSAPQVAGLAALMIHRNSQLQSWPEAVKAIIMASAVHNIEGNGRLSEYDGAGAIDAALADQAATFRQTTATSPCSSPCWWATTTGSTTPSVGGTLDRYFLANQGERIRVVLSWMANADSEANNYSFDRLDTNFDLRIFTAGNSQVDTSTSVKNNYEIVDFIATQTTTYRIEVKKQSNNGEANNSLGIAWVKLGTYLPDVRSNSGGWNSNIVIRNDDVLPSYVKITYFNPSGTFHSEQFTPALTHDTLWTPALPANWSGTAIVNGSEDLSVIVRQSATGRASLDNSYRSSGSDPAFDEVASTLYAPVFYRNFGSTLSKVTVQNAGSSANNITVFFDGRSGYNDYSTTGNVAAGGSATFDTSAILQSPWVGSLRIVGSQPLTAKVEHNTTGGTGSRSSSAASWGRSLIYAAAAYKNSFGYNTGFAVQNLSAGSITVTLTYCERTWTPPGVCPGEQVTLGAWKAAGFNLATFALLPASWNGTIKAQSDNGAPLAMTVNNSSSGGGYDYNATGVGSRIVFLPRAGRDVGGVNSGYIVRNVNGSAVTITARFYDSAGVLTWPQPPYTLQAGQALGHAQGSEVNLPANWQGSIVLEATGLIIAVVHEAAADSFSAYSGIGR